MDFVTFIILIILGFVYAILASMIGIGGGLLYTPTLDFVFGLETKDATFVSSLVIVFTSTSGFLNYRSQNRIDLKTARSFLTFAVPGALIGALFADQIPRDILRQLFGIVVGVAALRGISKTFNSKGIGEPMNEDEPGVERRIIVDSDGIIHEYLIKIGRGRYLAFIGGLIAGLLGVGGGIIYMPILTTFSGVPVHIASATSTTMIVVVSLIAVVTRTSARVNDGSFDINLWIEYGVPLMIGSVLGARLGSSKVKKLDSQKLLVLFWSVALIAGIRLFISPYI